MSFFTRVAYVLSVVLNRISSIRKAINMTGSDRQKMREAQEKRERKLIKHKALLDRQRAAAKSNT